MFLWNEIYNSASDPQTKQNALTHLQLLRAQDDCEHLDAIGGGLREAHRKTTMSMRDVVAAGLLPSGAVDALGFVYSFDADGKAQLNPASPLSRTTCIPKAVVGRLCVCVLLA